MESVEFKDGEDHINIYSKGQTELGQYLSNFARSPFIDTYCGKFDSIEGYWYYNLTGENKLRGLSNYQAKKLGQELCKQIEKDEWTGVNKQKIKVAILCKLTQNRPEKLNEFIKSTLPFRHYYVYAGKIIEPKEGKWIVDFFEDLRKALNDS